MMPNTPLSKEKTKALDLALQQIEKQFGKGAIMKLGEERASVAIETIPTGSISKSNTTVIFINQIRMQIGVMFGNPETTAGGRALKFYASVRLDIRRIATLKEGETAVGNRTKVKVVKNKVAAPFREAEFDIIYNEGISREGELIDFALEKGLIQKSGTWFSFGEERIGQGRENARLFLKEHGDIRAQLEAKLLPMLGLKTAAPPAPGAPPPKPAPGAVSPRPQPALVASGDRKR